MSTKKATSTKKTPAKKTKRAPKLSAEERRDQRRQENLPSFKALKAAQFAHYRKSVLEDSTVEVNGHRYKTDSCTRYALAAKLAAINSDNALSVPLLWKSQDGFVKLDAKDLQAVLNKIEAKVQLCFDREARCQTDLANTSDWETTAKIQFSAKTAPASNKK